MADIHEIRKSADLTETQIKEIGQILNSAKDFCKVLDRTVSGQLLNQLKMGVAQVVQGAIAATCIDNIT